MTKRETLMALIEELEAYNTTMCGSFYKSLAMASDEDLDDEANDLEAEVEEQLARYK